MSRLLRMEYLKEAGPHHLAGWKGSMECEGWEEALSKTNSLAGNQETKKETHRENIMHL